MKQREQNIRKQIDCKRPSSRKTNELNRLQNIYIEIYKYRYNQVRLGLAVFASTKLTLYQIKQDSSCYIPFQRAFNDKVVIARSLVQYWQIFSSFLIFCYYFTRLKAREISCKM